MTEYEPAYAGVSDVFELSRVDAARHVAAFGRAFVGKTVVDVALLELDATGDGAAVDQLVKFTFDDGTFAVLAGDDGVGSNNRYACVSVVPDTREFDHWAAKTTPVRYP